MALASVWGGGSDLPACGPPASFSVHMTTNSAVTPAGYVHKSIGDNVVHMLMQLKRCCCMPFSTILVVNPGSPGLEISVLVSS